MAWLRDIIRQEQDIACSRREFLRIGSGFAASLLLPASGLATAASHRERSLNFYNTHTDERLKTCYWAEGDYLPEGLQEINTILRDHRTGDTKTIDTRVLDILYTLSRRLDTPGPFHIISGYRSPATNAALHRKSPGVATHSFHTQGMAIDFRVPGCRTNTVHTAAVNLRAGGVGYYPESDFIHVDCGPVRYW